jgi:hypothetical protein
MATNQPVTKTETQSGPPSDKNNVQAVKKVEGGPEEPHPDGPERPHWLWLNGQRHRIESVQAWKLLVFFWTREAAQFQELWGPEPGKVWPDPVGDSTFTTAANRFNTAMPGAFPFRLKVKNGTLFRESVTQESRQNHAP